MLRPRARIIRGNKEVRVIAAFIAENPHTEFIPDPEWIDPEDDSKAPLINKYTDVQWINRIMDRLFNVECERGANKIAKQAKESLGDIYEPE